MQVLSKGVEVVYWGDQFDVWILGRGNPLSVAYL